MIIFLVVAALCCLSKPIKILAPIDLHYPWEVDLVTAGYLNALSPINLNGSSFNSSDFQIDRIVYESNQRGLIIDKIGWACRSGEYQGILAYTRQEMLKSTGYSVATIRYRLLVLIALLLSSLTSQSIWFNLDILLFSASRPLSKYKSIVFCYYASDSIGKM